MLRKSAVETALPSIMGVPGYSALNGSSIKQRPDSRGCVHLCTHGWGLWWSSVGGTDEVIAFAAKSKGNGGMEQKWRGDHISSGVG
jgi:hypothetical protein